MFTLCTHSGPSTEDAQKVHREGTKVSKQQPFSAQTVLICLSRHQLCVKQYSQDNNNNNNNNSCVKSLALICWFSFCVFLAWTQLGPVERQGPRQLFPLRYTVGPQTKVFISTTIREGRASGSSSYSGEVGRGFLFF